LTRVIVVSHESSDSFVGGHVTQRDETVRALVRAGVDARVGSPEEASSGSFDIVHVFGGADRVLELGRPDARVVVTPIYFPRRIELGPRVGRPGYRHLMVRTARNRLQWLRHPRARYRRLQSFRTWNAPLAHVDMLVVNSRAEASWMRHDLRRLPPLRVAYSGVGDDMFDGDPALGRAALGIDDEPFVLGVGRISPNKNPLAVALALRGLPHRLVLVGAVPPGREAYMEEIRRAAPGLLHVPHLERGVLRHVYAAAAVHVLASRFETTGLVTLEALAAGTPVVVGDGGPQREYFGRIAAFCRPASIRSVRRAITRALEGPTGREIELARHYSWDRTAEQLIEAYAA
jgi:glycosyltransferase involved in cell wall biosynthesis